MVKCYIDNSLRLRSWIRNVNRIIETVSTPIFPASSFVASRLLFVQVFFDARWWVLAARVLYLGSAIIGVRSILFLAHAAI
jgi:hypothetical protein